MRYITGLQSNYRYRYSMSFNRCGYIFLVEQEARIREGEEEARRREEEEEARRREKEEEARRREEEEEARRREKEEERREKRKRGEERGKKRKKRELEPCADMAATWLPRPVICCRGVHVAASCAR